MELEKLSTLFVCWVLVSGRLPRLGSTTLYSGSLTLITVDPLPQCVSKYWVANMSVHPLTLHLLIGYKMYPSVEYSWTILTGTE